MILRRNLAAIYPLNARTGDGQRLETDTLVDAEYTMDVGGDVILEKTLTSGLEIRHSDNLGDGFLYVNVSVGDLPFAGKMRQRLTITKCDGSRFPVTLRPEFIFIED